jgi:hypothetical protein
MKKMDHIIFPYCIESELKNLSSRKNPMIIRGTQTAGLPYGAVKEGDTLYFIGKQEVNEVTSCGRVSCVIYSEKLSEEESVEMVITYQDRLQLPDDQFYKVAGKKYLTIIGVENYHEIFPFRIEHKFLSEKEQWISVENIRSVVTGKEENFVTGIIAI